MKATVKKMKRINFPPDFKKIGDVKHFVYAPGEVYNVNKVEDGKVWLTCPVYTDLSMSFKTSEVTIL